MSGVLLGALGVCLLLAAFGLEVHAARAEQVAAGEPIVISAGRVAHVVGVVEPGTDAGSSTACTVNAGTGTETVGVGTRREALEGVRVGVRIRAADAREAIVVCDRRVAVASGVLVNAYPLASSLLLYPVYAALAFLGLAYARRRSRPRASSSPVQPGDDEARADLRRFTAKVVLGFVGAIAGFGAIVFGVVSLLVWQEASPAALLFLAAAGILGGGALAIGVWRRRVDVDES